MKRDDDFLRDLLTELVESPDPTFQYVSFSDDGAISDKRNYHLDLLEDAGFIVTTGDRNDTNGSWAMSLGGRKISRMRSVRVTNSGHDYLDVIRDQNIWQMTKKAVEETGGSVTLEIIKSLATGFLKKKIETHTGITL